MLKTYTQNLGGRKKVTMKKHTHWINTLGDVKPCGEIQLWQKQLVTMKRR